MGTEAWSAFDARANISENNNPQIMILDTTFPANAQNQRASVTQILRSGMNLSDLSSVSTAVTNLGATSASTANALVRRDASGFFNASGISIDNATTPTLNIGGSASFNLGIATSGNQFFTGTVNGDVCIRQTNTARQLLLGVGGGAAQFAVQNAVVQSNITHRFAYAGTNRMPFLNGTSDLSGSANYTVNGTGGLTITQGFTAATGTFSGLNAVTINGTTPAMLVGVNTQVAGATSNNNFFNPSLTGDTCIKNTSTSNFMRIGVGSADAQLIIGNTQVIVGVPIASSSVGANRMPFTNATNQIVGSANYTVDGSGALTIAGLFTSAGANFTSSVNVTATNQAYNLGSSQMVTLAKVSGTSSFFTGTLANDGVLRLDNTGASLFIGVGATTAQQIIKNAEIDFNVGIKLPTSGATAGLLNYYEENITFDMQMEAPDGANHTYNVIATRIGKVVTLRLPELNVAAAFGMYFQSTIPLPSKWRPPVTQDYAYSIMNNSIDEVGKLWVSDLGSIRARRADSGVFTASGGATIYAASVSYTVA